jgi:hypothetical protein
MSRTTEQDVDDALVSIKADFGPHTCGIGVRRFPNGDVLIAFVNGRDGDCSAVIPGASAGDLGRALIMASDEHAGTLQ